MNRIIDKWKKINKQKLFIDFLIVSYLIAMLVIGFLIFSVLVPGD